MLNELLRTTQGGTYKTPSVMIVSLDSQMILCSSCGATQNYGSQNFWNLGEEN